MASVRFVRPEQNSFSCCLHYSLSLPMLDARIPSGALGDKWTRFQETCPLVSPNNKRKHTVLIVGTGLAGASAAATLAELGYQVKSFCIQDSPRRAHSIAAQGGINATKNYPNDGDSVWRLFYDTLKGGDYRSEEHTSELQSQSTISYAVFCLKKKQYSHMIILLF